MTHNNLLLLENYIKNKYMKPNIPNIEIGDNIKIKLAIKEGNKKRIQMSEGVVISKKNTKINTSITIRKIVQNIGIEKVYLIHSPLIMNIDIIQKAKVKKSKLYYLRQRSGKTTKLKIRK